MSLKFALIAVMVSGCIGSVIGVLVATHFAIHNGSISRDASKELHELVIRDKKGNISIKLYNGEYGPVIALVDPSTGRDAIRVSASQESRGIHFLTSDGDSVAALVSTNPLKASTLYLGDLNVRRRIILGAHQNDMSYHTKESLAEWGLSMRNPRNIAQDLARIMVVDYVSESGPRVIEYRASSSVE